MTAVRTNSPKLSVPVPSYDHRPWTMDHRRLSTVDCRLLALSALRVLLLFSSQALCFFGQLPTVTYAFCRRAISTLLGSSALYSERFGQLPTADRRLCTTNYQLLAIYSTIVFIVSHTLLISASDKRLPEGRLIPCRLIRTVCGSSSALRYGGIVCSG